MSDKPAAVTIEFKGVRACGEFERFMREVIVRSGLGKTVFIYVDYQVNGGGHSAEKICLRGVVGNRVAFKAQGRKNNSCYRGTIFVSAGTATQAFDTLSALGCATVQDRDDMTDAAEGLKAIAETLGTDLTDHDVVEMLGIQVIQNMVNGKTTEVHQLRGILRQLGVERHIDQRVKRFCHDYLKLHPRSKGYVPTVKLATTLRDMNFIGSLRDSSIVASAVQQYAAVQAEIDQLNAVDASSLLEANNARVASLRQEIERIEQESQSLRLSIGEDNNRKAELEATKAILMELTIGEEQQEALAS